MIWGSKEEDRIWRSLWFVIAVTCTLSFTQNLAAAEAQGSAKPVAAQPGDPTQPSPGADPGSLQPLSSMFSVPAIMQRAKGVALLKVAAGNEHYYPCTGFLVDSQTLLTNYHCIQNQATCDGTKFVFGYWRDAAGEIGATETFTCDKYLGGQEALDFALVTLNGLAKGQSKWPWLPLGLNNLDSQTQLYILQHPRGTPMEISGPVVKSKTGQLAGFSCGVLEGVITSVHGYQDDSNFSYSCATQPGSSGSPVLDEKNCVVGLHHGAESKGASASASASDREGVNLGVLMKVLRPELTNRPLQPDCK